MATSDSQKRLTPSARQSLCALVLAAGLSTRMKPLLQGRSKALCGLQGKPLLERCCGVFKGAGLARIYVVTGHESAAVSSVAQSLGAVPIYNPHFQDGMFSSIRAGVTQVAKNPLNHGFFLLPVDIPLLKPAILEDLILAWEHLGEARQKAFIIPEVNGAPGHPPLIGREHWPSILGWSGEGGLQGYVASLPKEGQGCEINEADEESEANASAETDPCDVNRTRADKPAPQDPRDYTPTKHGQESHNLAGKSLTVHRLDVDDETVLWDIDTPDDLEKAAFYLATNGV